MPIMFNTILEKANILPLSDVRLLRHKDDRASRGRSPYELWRCNPEQFELYQSVQSVKNRARLNAQYWASFVGTPDDQTLFVGLYEVRYRGLLEHDTPMPHRNGVDLAGSCDVYDLMPIEPLNDLIGKLLIVWGAGFKSFIQRADKKNKSIKEFRELKELPFPGLMNFIEQLSKLNSLPPSWITTLKQSKGVYLLTCPRTKEQYVGSARGVQNLWGRWQEYIRTGHGGDVALKSRELSDYQVSILEVAGTSATEEDILAMEGRWQSKLQSREMGLNRNLAKATRT